MEQSELLVTGEIYSFDLGEMPFTHMLVRDGKVALLARAPLPCSGPRLVLGDQVVVPTFIDSHVHLLELGLQSVFPDLTQADCLDAAFDLILSARNQAREFGVLIAFNLEPDNLREKRMPFRRELDRLIPDRPVLVYRIDGHSASLNTQALRTVFENRDATVLAAKTGGVPIFGNGLELDTGHEPTGLVSALAYETASRWFKARLTREVKLRAFELACRSARLKGVLTVGALVGSDEPGDDIPELLVEHLPHLPLEIVVFPQTRSIERVQRLGLRRIGGCILIDGSLGSHTAALDDDYADAPGKGRLYFQDTELSEFFKSADANGLQFAVHAIGDRAVRQVLDSSESFMTLNRLRHRIEHAELLNSDLIRRIAQRKFILGVQPAFEHYWGGPGRMYERRLGLRYRQTNPYRELLQAGVILAGGSDAPITPIDPGLGVRSAVNHPVAEHRVTPLQACRMFTDWAAYSLGLESRKGSLSPGHDADFAVLTHNPLKQQDFSVARLYRFGEEVRP
jgi:hypothetical protein